MKRLLSVAASGVGDHLQLRGNHHVLFYVGDGWAPHHHEARCKLVTKHRNGFDNAGFAIGGKAVQNRPADADTISAECETFKDVGATADAAVDKNGDLSVKSGLPQRGHHFDKNFHTASRIVELPSPVVRHHNSLRSAFGRKHGILSRLYTFEADRKFCDTRNPFDV